MDDAGRYLDLRRLFVSQAVPIEVTALVPACPAWDVHDLLAHQVHQLASACDGTFPVHDALDALVGAEADRRRAARVRQDRWVAGGVAARRDVPIAELTAAWDDFAFDAPKAALAALFPDLAVHLFDLLGSVNCTDYRNEPFVVAALRFWARNCAIRLQQARRGPLRLELDQNISGSVESIGPADAPLIVTGTPFELLRAIVGRRSRRQAGALRWEGADELARESFAVYGWRPDDLDE